MEILTSGVIDARSAFEAMLSGKPVVCRDVHSELIRDYSPLADFAADIYANPNFEFAIQIEVIELAGFTFTKPYTLDELANGDAIFVIDTTGKVLKGVFDSTNTALVDSVNNGSVQRNEENAVNQIKAWRKVLGLNEIDIVVTDLPPVVQEKSKRKSAPKNSQSEASNNDVEKELSTSPITLKDNYQKEIEHLTEKVKQATSPAQANSVVAQTKHWTEEQRKPLLKSISAQLVKFTTPVEESAQKKPIAMRINQADSLDQLEFLKQEVITHDEIIQPQLNELISNRKNTLEGLGA